MCLFGFIVVIFLLFWNYGIESNVGSRSGNVGMKKANSWSQEKSETFNILTEKIKDGQNLKMGKIQTRNEIGFFGGRKVAERTLQKKYHLRGEKDFQKRSLTEVNNQRGVELKHRRDSKKLKTNCASEDRGGKLTNTDSFGNQRIQKKRKKRFVQPDTKENRRKNSTQSWTRNKGSPFVKKLTCYHNCSVIRQTFDYEKNDCQCEVCCPISPAQGLFNFANLAVQILANSSRCNCTQGASRIDSKRDFVRSECIDNYWMITSCDSFWPEDQVARKCKSGSKISSTGITAKNLNISVPVFSSDGEVFRNRYCALCNGKTIFEAYKVVFDCNTPPPKSYSSQKAMEYLFSHCKTFKWQPTSKQISQPCPKIHVSCSGLEVRDFRVKKQVDSSVSTYGYNLTGVSESIRVRCSTCEKIKTLNCFLKPQLFKPVYPRINLELINLVPISFALDIMNYEKSALVKVSCPREKPVYDPYMEECRYALIPSPKLAVFNSYRIRLFVEDFALKSAMGLENFKEFLDKEFGFVIFRPRNFTNGFQFDVRIDRLSNDSTKFYKLHRLLHFTDKFNITFRDINLSVYKVTYRTLTCANLEYHEKHEYTVLHGYMPAVYINKSRETISYSNYYPGRNDTIIICRLRLNNCSGVYIPLDNEQYTMMGNNSIYLKESGTVYNQDEYDIYNGTFWICVNFPKTFSVYKKTRMTTPFALSILTFVCMSLSIAGLVFVLVTYSLFSELRTTPGINLMNLSVSILFTQLLWLFGSGQTDTPMACAVIAVILHYLFLVSFMWSSIIAFDTWKAFSAKRLADSRQYRMRQSLRYMAVGWLPVMMYVGMCVAFDKHDVVTIEYGSYLRCFITDTTAKLRFFVAPVIVFVIFNLVFFAMTVKAIKETRSQTKLISHQLVKKQDLRIYVRIACLMGFTWIFGFAAPFGWQFLWYPFVILNSLQGVYIALAFAVSKRARCLYIDLYHGKRTRSRNRQSTSRSGKQERSTKQSRTEVWISLLCL